MRFASLTYTACWCLFVWYLDMESWFDLIKYNSFVYNMAGSLAHALGEIRVWKAHPQQLIRWLVFSVVFVEILLTKLMGQAIELNFTSKVAMICPSHQISTLQNMSNSNAKPRTFQAPCPHILMLCTEQGPRCPCGVNEIRTYGFGVGMSLSGLGYPNSSNNSYIGSAWNLSGNCGCCKGSGLKRFQATDDGTESQRSAFQHATIKTYSGISAGCWDSFWSHKGLLSANLQSAGVAHLSFICVVHAFSNSIAGPSSWDQK